ncbi:MAG: hypothetical protein ABWZ66_07385 [Pyrinomonadaceae bacterium]
MNKIKYLFIAFLCAALIGGAGVLNAPAQNDKVLVSASGKTLKQSDVNTLIEFYEWAFQASFTSKQRADYQKYTESEFRADPKESCKTIDDIVTTFPKIIAASEDLQAATRKNFLDAFLPEARKMGDANSQMLLAIYENANGATNETVTSNQEKETQSDDSYETVKKVNVGNFSAIVGKWVSGSSGSMTTTTSGVYLGGNGSRHTYQFGANGAVEYTGIMNVMTGGCRMQIFKSARGKAVLNGNTLTINWQPASFSRDDSCSPSKNYKKTLPAETETFQINFETYFDDKQLCLTGSDKMCMSRD